jgi:hypothetical protein
MSAAPPPMRRKRRTFESIVIIDNELGVYITQPSVSTRDQSKSLVTPLVKRHFLLE